MEIYSPKTKLWKKTYVIKELVFRSSIVYIKDLVFRSSIVCIVAIADNNCSNPDAEILEIPVELIQAVKYQEREFLELEYEVEENKKIIRKAVVVVNPERRILM